MHHPTEMILGRGLVRPALRRALWPPALVLLLALALVVFTRRSGWLGVGGAVIASYGTWLWGTRLIRMRGYRSDEQLPPQLLPMEPGARTVAMNPEFIPAMQRQSLDNLYAKIGVWLSIAGGLIGGAGPFLLGLLDDAR